MPRTPPPGSQTELPVTTLEGETRIRDLDLAARLGFDVPQAIRRLIARHAAALREMGLLVTMTERSGNSSGRSGRAHYLNRKQALFITAKSDTSTAVDITIEVIERFDAYERGEAMAAVRRQQRPTNATERKIFTASWNAANRAVAELRRCCGVQTAAHAAPQIYDALGLRVDLTCSSTLAQGQFDLSNVEPIRKPSGGKEGA